MKNQNNAVGAEKLEILIAEIAKVMPVVHEIRAVYTKWRVFYREQGKSDAIGHKKASEIIIRDYPHFNAEAALKGF